MPRWLSRMPRACCVAGTSSGGGTHRSSIRSAPSASANTRGWFPVMAQRIPNVASSCTAGAGSSSTMQRRSTSARLFSSTLISSHRGDLVGAEQAPPGAAGTCPRPTPSGQRARPRPHRPRPAAGSAELPHRLEHPVARLLHRSPPRRAATGRPGPRRDPSRPCRAGLGQPAS